jgi:hypothetical protein
MSKRKVAMNAKAPAKPPTADELRAMGGKPTTSPPPPPPPRKELQELRQAVPKPPFPPDIPKSHAFPVRVALVCQHCSSYMQRIGNGDLMTCKSEGCPLHLKRFKVPVLWAEEVEQ